MGLATLMVSAITCEPGGVDVVRPLVIVSRTEEDSVAVSRQQVWAPVLALVTDPQSGAVLGLAGVIGADQLKTPQLFSNSVSCLLFNEEFSFGCQQHDYS